MFKSKICHPRTTILLRGDDLGEKHQNSRCKHLRDDLINELHKLIGRKLSIESSPKILGIRTKKVALSSFRIFIALKNSFTPLTMLFSTICHKSWKKNMEKSLGLGALLPSKEKTATFTSSLEGIVVRNLFYSFPIVAGKELRSKSWASTLKLSSAKRRKEKKHFASFLKSSSTPTRLHWQQDQISYWQPYASWKSYERI